MTFIKKITYIVPVLLLTLASLGQAASKVAIFSPEAAIMNSKAYKQSVEDLNRSPEFAKMMAEYEAKQAELKSLDEESKSKGLTWSTEQVADFRKKVDYLQLDMQGLVKKIKAEQKSVGEKVMVKAQKTIPEILKKIAKKDKIDLILRADAAVHISDEAVDITKKVIDELNK